MFDLISSIGISGAVVIPILFLSVILTFVLGILVIAGMTIYVFIANRDLQKRVEELEKQLKEKGSNL